MQKQTLLLIFLTAIISSCSVSRKSVSTLNNAAGVQQEIIDYGMKHLNKPYRYASNGPNSFDCSGYTSFVFQKFGYKLSKSSTGQDKQVPTIYKKEDLRVGDLVFFEGRQHDGNVGHVGIVKETFSNGDFKFLHASTQYGVIVSRSTEEYYASRYLRGGRVFKENNQVVLAKNSKKNKKEPDTQILHKRNNTFSAAKVKEQVLVEAPKTQTEKEIEMSLAKNRNTAELEKLKNDTLIIHSRLSPLRYSDTSSSTKNKDLPNSAPNKQVLRSDPASLPRPTVIKTNNGQIEYHEIKPGDTLYSVSRMYGCTINQLRDWNPQLGDVLKSGEKLTLHIQEQL